MAGTDMALRKLVARCEGQEGARQDMDARPLTRAGREVRAGGLDGIGLHMQDALVSMELLAKEAGKYLKVGGPWPFGDLPGGRASFETGVCKRSGGCPPSFSIPRFAPIPPRAQSPLWVLGLFGCPVVSPNFVSPGRCPGRCWGLGRCPHRIFTGLWIRRVDFLQKNR